MAVSVDQLGKAIVQSGVMPADELKSLWAAIPAGQKPKDSETFAALLVKQGKLTQFQSGELLSGAGTPLVLGDYILVAKIGAGGMGQVFKAEHRHMKRLVAIKLLSSALTKDEAAVKRFQREVQAAARLSHPNIVAALDARFERGVWCLVMEYVEGRDLSAIVKERGPLPVAEAVNCILQAARGLAYAHGEGVVHRDIKPANLLLDKRGTVKVLDMGLARIDNAADAADHQLTGTGAVMGTVDYMAPEQAASTHDADHRSDIYSLGCSLYRLLIGGNLYDAETVIKKILAHMSDPIPSLAQKRPDVPASLDRIFQRMVAKKPEDRYQQTIDLVAELEAWLNPGATVSLSPSSTAGGGQLNDFLRTFGPASGSASAVGLSPAKSATHTGFEQTVAHLKPELATDPKSEVVAPASKAATSGRGVPSPGAGLSAVQAPRLNKRVIALIAAGTLSLLGILVVLYLALSGGPKVPPADNPQSAIRNPQSAPSALTPYETGSPDGWIEPFNGRDLAGWLVRPADAMWRVGAAALNSTKPGGLVVGSGGRDLIRADGGKAGDVYTQAKWADVQVELEFMLSAGSNSGVFLMGEYEINLTDNANSGNIHRGAKPLVQANKGPGEWQTLSIDFRAPRFEGDKKIANARFVKVVYNGQLIHENVELAGVTEDGSCLTHKEAPTGPLLLQGMLGNVAYRNICIRPLDGKSTAPPLAAAAASVVYLDDLQETAGHVHGGLGKHGAIRWQGKTPKHSLFTQPKPRPSGAPLDPAWVTYAIDGNYAEFRAIAGLAQNSQSPVTMRVFGDDKLLWESQPLSERDVGIEVAVGVRGVKTLKLEVFAASGTTLAHAVWIDPRLTPAVNPQSAIPNPKSPAIPAEALTFGGHRYLLVESPGTWAEAKAKAEAMGGHLVTISTPEERDWVHDNLYRKLQSGGSLGKRMFIGGARPRAVDEWKWVTGEPIDTTLAPTQDLGGGTTLVWAQDKWMSAPDPARYSAAQFLVEWDTLGPTTASVAPSPQPPVPSSTPLRWPLAPSKSEDIAWLQGLQATLTLRSGPETETTLKPTDPPPATPATIVGVQFNYGAGGDKMVTDQVLARVATLVDLETLRCVFSSPNCPATGAGVSSLAPLANLRNLALGRIGPAATDPAFLAKFRNLEVLHLQNLTWQGWEPHVAQLKGLKELDLYNMDGAKLEQLGPLPKLAAFRFAGYSNGHAKRLPAAQRFAEIVPWCRIRLVGLDNDNNKEMIIGPTAPLPSN